MAVGAALPTKYLDTSTDLAAIYNRNTNTEATVGRASKRIGTGTDRANLVPVILAGAVGVADHVGANSKRVPSSHY